MKYMMVFLILLLLVTGVGVLGLAKTPQVPQLEPYRVSLDCLPAGH